MSRQCNNLTSQQLGAIMKGTKADVIEKNLPHINRAMCDYDIKSPLEQAHFLAHMGHESQGLMRPRENLNYSGDRLKQVFPRHFKDGVKVEDYHRKPEKIGNRVYANRMGNGDEASGDGSKYRGRGLIQLTGKNNYSAFAKEAGPEVLATPDKVATDPALSTKAAAWFWNENNLNNFARKDDIVGATKVINGGTNGLQDRKNRLETAKSVLGVRE
ncbi:glycosyl hydrolase family 19 domain-containing protein HI_1415-like [Oratosquilla oratoria]|uniref:glycosyl hydrolase family 19 domain-containing protein HI_1415-like n=1 Tax=Oratosquilla oratoria TaxID=337810 RepID=UPI003F77322A